nr:hypothetical protein [Pseudonocardia sp. ICBG1142]
MAAVEQVIDDQVVRHVHDQVVAPGRGVLGVEGAEVGQQTVIGLPVTGPPPDRTVPLHHGVRGDRGGPRDHPGAVRVAHARTRGVELQAVVAAGDRPAVETAARQRREPVRAAVVEGDRSAVGVAGDQQRPFEHRPRQHRVRGQLARPGHQVPGVAQELHDASALSVDDVSELTRS